MRSYPGASGGRVAHVLVVFSFSLLLLGLLVLPASALPRSSPSLTYHLYTVNTTDDPGDGTCDATECTLREAIIAANGDFGYSDIAFDIPNPGPGCDGVTCTITLSSSLPPVTCDRTIIDGTTQTDTNPDGPEIVVNGSSTYRCFEVQSALNTIKGLVINQCVYYGIRITGSGAHDNTISGNYIGINTQGNAPLSNDDGGILILAAHDNTIGGTTEDARNVISGNEAFGVLIMGTGANANIVSGNYIGTNADGTTSVPNGFDGVYIYDGAQSNTIGPDNIIAYNGRDGVVVDGATTTGNTITRNSIHSNGIKGIYLTNGGNNDLAPPNLSLASCSSVSGSTAIPWPNVTIEVFSDADGQGRYYEEGSLTWVDDFNFIFYPTSGLLRGRMVTATATDASGNTSEFSDPIHCGCLEIFLPLIMKNY